MAGDSLKKQSRPVADTSADGKLFAVVQDGSLTVLNVIDNTLVSKVTVPHVDSQVTALCVFSETDKKGAKKRKSTASFSVLLGFADGNILLCVGGEFPNPAVAAHRSAVNDACYDAHHGLVLTAGQDGFLKRWSLDLQIQGEDRINGDPVYRIMLTSPSTVLIGQYQILLWDLSQRSALSTFTGHINGVSRLAPFGVGLFVSLGENESNGYVWEESNAQSPRGIIVASEPLVDVVAVQGEQIFVRGASQQAVYEFSMSQRSKKNVCKLVATHNVAQVGFLAVRDNRCVQLQIDRFYPLVAEADPALPSPQEATEKPSKRNKKKATATVATETIVPKEPLAQSEPMKPVESDAARSITVLLTQALKTDDSGRLEQAFSVVDRDSIDATLRSLESAMIAPLLKSLKERLVETPNRIQQLQHWVVPLVSLRTGDIRSDSSSLAQVQELLQLCTLQAALLPKVLVLKRIDQLRTQSVQERAKQTDSLAVRKILYYSEPSGKSVLGSSDIVPRRTRNVQFAKFEAEEETAADSD